MATAFSASFALEAALKAAVCALIAAISLAALTRGWQAASAGRSATAASRPRRVRMSMAFGPSWATRQAPAARPVVLENHADKGAPVRNQRSAKRRKHRHKPSRAPRAAL